MPRLSERHHRHWAANQRVTAVLLVLWFIATFVIAFFAREIDFAFFGWPFGFWVAAQGAPVVYVLLVWIYSARMERLDREHGVAEPPEA